MAIDRRKYLWRIKRLEIKSWLKYLMIEGKSVVDYVLGELMTGTDITINNTVEKKFYKFDVKGNSTQETTTGAQLFNKATSIDNYRVSTSQGNLWQSTGYSSSATIIVTGGEIYHLTTNITSYIAEYTSEGTFIRGYEKPSTGSMTLSANCGRIRFDYKSDDTTVMFSKGNTAKPYEEYTGGIASPNPSYPQTIYSAGDNGSISEKIENADGTQSQTYTIPCQQPMRSIGTVRDEFVKVNGEWKERHNIKEVEIDGSQGNASWNSWGRITPEYTNKIIYRRQNWNGWSKGLNDSLVISNCFKQSTFALVTGDNDRINEICGYNKTGIGLSFDINNSNVQNVEDFLNYMNTLKPKVYYALETPVDLPCTQEQISILENLPKSYNEQTNIYSLDVTPAYVEVQAYVKKEEVIEND